MHLKGFMHNGIFDSNKFQSYYNLLTSKTEKKSRDDFLFLRMVISLMMKNSIILHSMKRGYDIDEILIKLRKIVHTNGHNVSIIITFIKKIIYKSNYCP